MIDNILSQSILSRVVMLDNNNLGTLFFSMHPMRISVQREKRLTEFAVEDGSTKNDHVVFKPTEITIDLMGVDMVRSAYAGLSQSFINNNLIVVQTRVETFENMMIVDLPHEEANAFGDGIRSIIRLKEWREVTPETGEMPETQVAEAKQSDTVSRGDVRGSTPSSGGVTQDTEGSKKGSILSKVFG